MKRLIFFCIVSVAVVRLPAPSVVEGEPDATHEGHAQTLGKEAVVETSAGTFIIDLTPDAAPNQTAYFMKVANEGAYDGTTFHMMVKHGIVQGGDPISKDPAKRPAYGTGGLNMVKAEARAPNMTRSRT